MHIFYFQFKLELKVRILKIVLGSGGSLHSSLIIPNVSKLSKFYATFIITHWFNCPTEDEWPNLACQLAIRLQL